jgi:alpha/beta superfamily hydrolase
MVMVSPPVAVIDFGTVTSIPFLKLIVAGDRDEFAPPELIQKIFTQWNPDAHFEIINGSDHFYGGYLNTLETILSANLSRFLPTSK